MKLQHPHYANQKLNTEWGVMEVDADGIVEVKSEATDFFQKILKFKPAESQAPAKKAKVEAPPAPVVEPEDEVVESEEPEEAEEPKSLMKKAGAKAASSRFKRSEQ